MIELIARLLSRPGVAVLLLLSSFVISILMLVPPIYVMQVLNRYVAFGVDGTLFTLASGALLAVAMEFLLRWARLRIVTLPRLRAPLGFAAGLSAALSMGDLGVIALFAGQGQETLPLTMYRLMGAYRTDAAAAAGLVLIGAALALFWAFDKWGRRGAVL